MFNNNVQTLALRYICKKSEVNENLLIFGQARLTFVLLCFVTLLGPVMQFRNVVL